MMARRVVASGPNAGQIVCLAALATRALGVYGQEGVSGTAAPKHGFRHDPMQFARDSTSLEAARIRKAILGRPAPSDAAILSARIDEILAGQQADGALSDDTHHRYQFTAERLIELAQLGVDPEREGVRRAVEAILTHSDEATADPLGIYTVRALCLLGRGDVPQVRTGLEALVARQDEWNSAWEGCPWTPIEHLKTLWHGRNVLDSTELVVAALGWIRDGLNGAGCLSYKDPWGFVDVAGLVGHCVAGDIVRREVPLILRGQEADGGWGGRSVAVFRALQAHGVLEELRGLPPLPLDWRVVRQIPAPEGQLATLTYDGARLWVLDRAANEAVALSPAEGTVVRRLALPEGESTGVGWCDGGLGLTQSEPKRLLRVDAETGTITRQVALDSGQWPSGLAQIDGEVWVADSFLGCVLRVPADASTGRDAMVLAGPCPVDLAADGEGVWHSDAWAPAIFRTDQNGNLLDWGENPFGGRCDGLAWDGSALWALDAEGKRVCAIEKAVE